jgi:hypothetical protein
MIAVGGSGSIYDTNGVFKYLETASLFAAQALLGHENGFFLKNGFSMPFIHCQSNILRGVRAPVA